jgi:6-pyruvoyltetrahydropterin/6-carboxytetrahydropterin synthase
MKISKEFRWEMGHRLPYHEGLCRNIHGHSYKMVVEIEGDVDENGMIIDFYDLGGIVKPIIEQYDHAFLCWEKDEKLRKFLEENDMKRVVVEYQSTVENICDDFAEVIYDRLSKIKGRGFKRMAVRISETPNSSAEKRVEFPRDLSRT